MSQAQAPAARSLGDVLADIKLHRATCAAENVPTSPEKLLELHTEALEQAAEGQATIGALMDEISSQARRLEALEAAQAKPAAKTTKRAG